MIDRLFSSLAPHLCYSCGAEGELLCDSCKYNIVSEPFSQCLVCLSLSRTCSHRLPYQKAWCVGRREGILRNLIDGYKFERQWSGYKACAALLDGILPLLPDDTVIVAVPTISTHIRQRGYDHTLLVAAELARFRGLKVEKHIRRLHNLKQLGASSRIRREQASKAFIVKKPLEDLPYLLIDDIYTTGSTVKYASLALRQAGAARVWVAVIARQVSTQDE